MLIEGWLFDVMGNWDTCRLSFLFFVYATDFWVSTLAYYIIWINVIPYFYIKTLSYYKFTLLKRCFFIIFFGNMLYLRNGFAVNHHVSYEFYKMTYGFQILAIVFFFVSTLSNFLKTTHFFFFPLTNYFILYFVYFIKINLKNFRHIKNY